MNGLKDFVNSESGFSWILVGNEKCCIHINDDKLGDIIFDGFNRAWNNVECTKKRYLWHINQINIKIDNICQDIYIDTTTEEPDGSAGYWETTTTTEDPWYRGWNNRKGMCIYVFNIGVYVCLGVCLVKKKKQKKDDDGESYWQKTRDALLSNGV